jgi:acetyltransferase
VLLEAEARSFLAAEGIPVPDFAHSHAAADIVKVSHAMPKPLALKLLSAKLIHKSDAGGVLLNLSSPSEVSQGCEKLALLAREVGEDNPEYLITPMIAGGVEVIIGGKHDVQFGPIVLFGSGGILVEAVRDVKIMLAPCTARSARAAVESTIAGKLLAGHRGRRAHDISELVTLVVKISELISDRAGIAELDLNPVIVNEGGAHIADVRIVM